MLVRLLTGPNIGAVVDMNFDDARRAEANRAATILSADEAARFASGSAPADEPPPPAEAPEPEDKIGRASCRERV